MCLSMTGSDKAVVDSRDLAVPTALSLLAVLTVPTVLTLVALEN